MVSSENLVLVSCHLQNVDHLLLSGHLFLRFFHVVKLLFVLRNVPLNYFRLLFNLQMDVLGKLLRSFIFEQLLFHLTDLFFWSFVFLLEVVKLKLPILNLLQMRIIVIRLLNWHRYLRIGLLFFWFYLELLLGYVPRRDDIRIHIRRHLPVRLHRVASVVLLERRLRFIRGEVAENFPPVINLLIFGIYFLGIL